MSPTLPELLLTYPDITALRADHDRNLRKARAFVPGARGVAERQRCLLVLCHPDSGARLALPAEAVYVKADEPGQGVGVSVDPWGHAEQQRLAAFIEGAAPEADQPAAAEPAPPPAAGDEDHDEGDDHEKAAHSPAAQNLQERIRHLSSTEQMRMANNGSLQERIILERTYGPAVWESLLSNPRITTPEVARIAKKGGIPKPLLETIASNGAWVAASEVQRALLSNPRLGLHLVPRVLRALSRADLAMVPAQSAYPQAVRAAAKKMLQGG